MLQITIESSKNHNKKDFNFHEVCIAIIIKAKNILPFKGQSEHVNRSSTDIPMAKGKRTKGDHKKSLRIPKG
jgi:hypothetical protein